MRFTFKANRLHIDNIGFTASMARESVKRFLAGSGHSIRIFCADCHDFHVYEEIKRLATGGIKIGCTVIPKRRVNAIRDWANKKN